MTCLFSVDREKRNHASRSNSTTGASYSVKRPWRPDPKVAGDYGRHKGLHTERIIRIDSSCGYACFRGLFGVLAAVWRVFEVVLRLDQWSALDGLVASADLFVT